MSNASGTVGTPALRIEGLHKTFRREGGEMISAVDGVSFDVAEGEMVVLLGPSGCGKTTLLRCIAGLEVPDKGSIGVFGEPVFDARQKIAVPPERRQLGMIFQSYALWPHMTAFANVAFPLRSRRTARREIAPRVRDVLKAVDISELEEQYPGQMSGGQQQRVALARALVGGDRLVLFDEPLSNVDAKVREQLRHELIDMQRRIGFAAVYVTHDQTEAMELADRIAVLREGRIEQLGSPAGIYEEPSTYYVARFIGSINSVEGVADSTASIESAIGPVATARRPSHSGDAIILWRPECTLVSRDEPDIANRWHGEVESVIYSGAHTEYVIRVGEVTVRAWTSRGLGLREGSRAWIAVRPEDVRGLPHVPGELESKPSEAELASRRPVSAAVDLSTPPE